MANATFKQVYDANTFALLTDTTIFPVVDTPYGVGDDGGIDGAVLKEAIRDAVAAFVVQGSDITVTHDDGADTLTIAFSGTEAGRETLTADRDYYVNSNSLGNDTNDGLSASAPFATIQKAVDVAAALDTSIYDVSINIADGTYVENVELKTTVGAGTVTLLGNTTTPANVYIDVTNGQCIAAENIFGKYIITGMKLNTDGGAAACIQLDGAGSVVTAGDALIFENASYHMRIRNGAQLFREGDHEIISDADVHMGATFGGIIRAAFPGCDVTLTSTPAFGTTGSDGFASAGTGGIIAAGFDSYTGSATGRRYYVTGNSVITTNGGGASFFPGDAAGSETADDEYS